MLAFLLRRLGQSLLVLLVMATLVFVGVYALGNPIDILISPDADQIEREQAIERLGLDQPPWAQFWLFVKADLHGDLGRSFVHGVPAIDLILGRMPATLELACAALVLAVAIGIPLGLVAGLAPRSLAGRGIMAGSIVGFSLPNFWLGLMLILAFAVELQILPAGGRGETRRLLGIEWSFLTLDGIEHLILPALTLAIYKASLVTRLACAGTREALLQDFVRFARAKGLTRRRIVGVHVRFSAPRPRRASPRSRPRARPARRSASRGAPRARARPPPHRGPRTRARSRRARAGARRPRSTARGSSTSRGAPPRRRSPEVQRACW